jgi:N-acetylneuraminic acid mutarotase
MLPALLLATALLTTCSGDCDANDAVDQADLAQAVTALFTPDACAAADADANGSVTAAELLQVVLALDGACSEWIELPALPGGARQEVGVAALDQQVYVIGGFDAQGGGSRQVEVYAVDSGEWSRAATLPALRNHVGAAALDGAVWVVGGFVGSGFAPAAEVYRYDPAGDEWTTVAPLPAPRGALAVAAVQGLVYAVGGSGAGGSLRDCSAYHPGDDMWTACAPLPTPRNHLAAAALDGLLYVAGGRGDGSGFANSAALDRYDPSTNRWTALAPMPTARSGHALAAIGGRLVAMGGEVNDANPPTRVFPQVELYDPLRDRWARLDPMALPRHGIGAATVGDLVIVPGGATFAGFGATDHADALRLLR